MQKAEDEQSEASDNDMKLAALGGQELHRRSESAFDPVTHGAQEPPVPPVPVPEPGAPRGRKRGVGLDRFPVVLATKP